MTNREAAEKFKKADQLFRQGHFADALALLDELNAAYPMTKNIIYPRALCLAGLGRVNEVFRLCETLISVFTDPRAVKLRAKLFNSHADTAGAERQFRAPSALRKVLEKLRF